MRAGQLQVYAAMSRNTLKDGDLLPPWCLVPLAMQVVVGQVVDSCAPNTGNKHNAVPCLR